ncbi:MAG: hypothetical protein KGH79_00920 [Patescibacteria group bacterium]|nr:hypothetical protein [Patescibacteria group bacterium]
MKTSTIVWIVIVLIIIVGGVWWYSSSSNNAPAAGQAQDNTQAAAAGNTQANAPANSAPMSATVTYTAQGFSPSTVTIASGGTVRFVNQSGGAMYIASNPHPTHEGYDGTTRSEHCAAGYTGPAPFDQCTTGNTFSFTFTKTGTFGYHNHTDPSIMGTVIVQ